MSSFSEQRPLAANAAKSVLVELQAWAAQHPAFALNSDATTDARVKTAITTTGFEVSDDERKVMRGVNDFASLKTAAATLLSNPRERLYISVSSIKKKSAHAAIVLKDASGEVYYADANGIGLDRQMEPIDDVKVSIDCEKSMGGEESGERGEEKR